MHTEEISKVQKGFKRPLTSGNYIHCQVFSYNDKYYKDGSGLNIPVLKKAECLKSQVK